MQPCHPLLLFQTRTDPNCLSTQGVHHLANLAQIDHANLSRLLGGLQPNEQTLQWRGMVGRGVAVLVHVCGRTWTIGEIERNEIIRSNKCHYVLGDIIIYIIIYIMCHMCLAMHVKGGSVQHWQVIRHRERGQRLGRAACIIPFR